MLRLRKETEAEAKEILKNKTHFGPKEFEGRNKITKKRESSLHSLLPQEDIDYCINNNIDITYLHDEVISKYGGEEKERKQYYIPTGKKRGRPKKNNNEQEQ